MSRKRKLTEEQWAEIGRRLLDRESAASLGREFGVGESTIRSHFERAGQKTSEIQAVASQLFDAEQSEKAAQKSLQALSPVAQISALTLATRMRSVSEKLGAMADVSAGTSQLLANLANSEAQKIDDADPSKSKKHRESAEALQRAANDAALVPTKLMVAAVNSETIRRITDDRVPAGAEVMTAERLQEGARRVAFLLHRAAKENT